MTLIVASAGTDHVAVAADATMHRTVTDATGGALLLAQPMTKIHALGPGLVGLCGDVPLLQDVLSRLASAHEAGTLPGQPHERAHAARRHMEAARGERHARHAIIWGDAGARQLDPFARLLFAGLDAAGRPALVELDPGGAVLDHTPRGVAVLSGTGTYDATCHAFCQAWCGTADAQATRVRKVAGIVHDCLNPDHNGLRHPVRAWTVGRGGSREWPGPWGLAATTQEAIREVTP